MARPNFTVQLRGVYQSRTGDTSPWATRSGLKDRAIENALGPPRSRKVEGWLPPRPYTFEHDSYRFSEGSYSHDYRRNSSVTEKALRVRGNVFGSDTSNGPWYGVNQVCYQSGVPQRFSDQALVKARLAMKRSDVNLGVAFGERKMTAKLLGDTALSLVASARALRKGDWKRAARELGVAPPKNAPRGSNFTKKWLEYQYGWKPLLNDVYGAADALSRRGTHDWRVTGKGSAFENIDIHKELPPGVRVQDGGIGVAKGVRGVFVRIDAVPTATQSLASLGILNPALVAWELVPFSFVIDWALPIGSWLESLDAMIGYDNVSCSISSLERFTASYKLRDSIIDRSARDFDHVFRSGSATKRYVKLVRSVPASVPLPVLPRLKQPVSVGRMANALSLLTQVFGRGSHGRPRLR